MHGSTFLNRWTLGLALVALLGFALLPTPMSVSADDPIACPPDLGAGDSPVTEKVVADDGCEIEDLTLLGNVEVLENATVTVERSELFGNFELAPGACLAIDDASVLTGNVDCEAGGDVDFSPGAEDTGNIDESCGDCS